MQCASCGTQNPDGKKFCGECGAPLRSAAPIAELRQITVMFCDLVGSTALAEQLDPEDLREVTAAYHDVCSVAIARHDGHVAQYLGDGLLVYFGYPDAHEDDPRRAVRAGLEILRSMDAFNVRLSRERGVELAVRIGIHTGPVVVGEVGAGERREKLAMGRTPNLAARAQTAAEPGTVLVTGDTHRLVRDYFEFDALGSSELKGISEPVFLFRVAEEIETENRNVVVRGANLTPFVGREAELDQLQDAWADAVASRSRVVLVRGEAGIGKSRIVRALRDTVAASGATVIEASCSPYSQGSPLYPVIEMIERLLGFTRDTTVDEKRVLIDARLTRRGINTPETRALVEQLLSVAPAEGVAPLALTSQQQREKTLDTLKDWLIAVTRESPVLWVVEDLHWADPTTLELVGRLIAARPATPILMVLTTRPGFTPPWSLPGVDALTLERLPAMQSTTMIERVARGKALPEEVVEQVISRSGGNPLFLEEVTKAVLETGVLVDTGDRYELRGALPDDLVPTTVQGSLIARLDRLGPAKPVAQLAATIGREFRFDLLRAIGTDDEWTLRGRLDRLVDAELVFRVGDPPDETYMFKHALIQDTAYQTVLKKSRREMHARIASALTTQFTNIANARPELLAEHLTRSGQTESAARQWLLAARIASARVASHETVAHAKRGLELVAMLSDELREPLELELLVTLPPVITQIKGWAAPELADIFARANALMDKLGDNTHRFTVLSFTFAFHLVAGRVNKARDVAHDVLALATAIGHPALIQVGHANSCCAALYSADFRSAKEHGEAALATYDIALERWILGVFGNSNAVQVHCYMAEISWQLGELEASARYAQRARALAGEYQHGASEYFANSFAPGIYTLLGDIDNVIASADTAIQLGREQKLTFWDAIAMMFKGYALAGRGQLTDGIAMMRDGRARHLALGCGGLQARMSSMLADALGRAGEITEGIALVERAMRVVDEDGEHLYEPELYRVRGELLMRQADESLDQSAMLEAARASIERALEIARRQEARSLELRATLSLQRLDDVAGLNQSP